VVCLLARIGGLMQPGGGRDMRVTVVWRIAARAAALCQASNNNVMV